MIKSDIRGETIKYSSQINKVKTINVERELTELQNKKQASNREVIDLINVIINCMVLKIKRLIKASLFSKNFLEISYSVSFIIY
jgi:hypothetical protein